MEKENTGLENGFSYSILTIPNRSALLDSEEKKRKEQNRKPHPLHPSP
jgi:hypothetical protein